MIFISFHSSANQRTSFFGLSVLPSRTPCNPVHRPVLLWLLKDQLELLWLLKTHPELAWLLKNLTEFLWLLKKHPELLWLPKNHPELHWLLRNHPSLLWLLKKQPRVLSLVGVETGDFFLFPGWFCSTLELNSRTKSHPLCHITGLMPHTTGSRLERYK